MILLASFGLLISDAKLLIETFRDVSFSHVQSQGNSVTLNFTRHAKHVTGLLVWIKCVPSHFNSAMLADLAFPM